MSNISDLFGEIIALRKQAPVAPDNNSWATGGAAAFAMAFAAEAMGETVDYRDIVMRLLAAAPEDTLFDAARVVKLMPQES